MDVAYYLSELLGQLGEINVPGLGYFAQIRIEGYYNAADATFYPPKNKVQFDPQIIDDDDDTLAQYIADKRNISLASSRYFTEKYISNLKKEALMKDVPLADLGSLYMEGSNISFKPADVMQNDPTVFGYTPLHMEKLEGPSFVHQMETHAQAIKEQPPAPEAEPPKLPEPDPAYELPQTSQLTYESVIQEAEALASKPEPMPVPETEPYIPPVKPEEQEEFVFQGKTYVSPEGRSYKWLWITAIILGVLVIGVLGMLAIHKYKPTLYNQMRGVAPAPVSIKVPLRTDSLKKDSVTKDTTQKAAATTTDTAHKTVPAVTPPSAQNSAEPAIDSTKVRYEVMATTATTQKEADGYIKNLQSQGLPAHVVRDVPGKKLHISVGTYMVQADAYKKKIELVSTHKIPSDAYVRTIIPKK
jgi:cell division septation protein DedD